MKLKQLQENWINGYLNKKTYWELAREQYTSALPNIQDILSNSSECEEIRITKDGCILIKSNGLKMYFDFGQSICRAEADLLMKEDPETGGIEFINDYLKNNNCTRMIDIGANVGLFGLELALSNPDIEYHMFEPLPTTFEMLKKTVKLNEVNEDKFVLNNLGMSDEEGSFDFFLPGSSEAASLKPIEDEFYLKESDEYGNYSGKSTMKKVECRVTTLDKYVLDNKIDKIDFIKIDVEGNEKAVLFGAIQTLEKFHPLIYCELLRKHAARFGYHPNDVIEYLKRFGYKCKTIRNNVMVDIEAIDNDTVETNFFFMI